MRSLRILIVDDEVAMQRMLTKALELAGHQITVASNGVDALRAVAAGSFDLVITDLVMPEMEGIELLRKLHATESPPKIIAMSGGRRNPGSDYLKMASFLGADATIEKPFTHTDLRDVIIRVFATTMPAQEG